MRRRVMLAVLLTTTLAVIAFFVPASVAIHNAQKRGELLELEREAFIAAGRLANLQVNDTQELRSILDARHPISLYSINGEKLFGTGPAQPDRIVQPLWQATSQRGTSAATSSPRFRLAPLAPMIR